MGHWKSPCISYPVQGLSMPWISTQTVSPLADYLGLCVRVALPMPMEIHKPLQWPWKSTLSKWCQGLPMPMEIHMHLCSAMDAMEMHYPSLPLVGPGFANAWSVLGARLCQCPWNPQIFAVPWMPWKSTLSQSTLIGPGFANAHAYPPSRMCACGCHGCRMPMDTLDLEMCYPGLVPGFANAHGNPQSLCSTMGAMEIHTIQVYPYRARVCQCPCNICSAMDAMEIHTIPVYPYRAGSMDCQHGNPQIFSLHYPSLPL